MTNTLPSNVEMSSRVKRINMTPPPQDYECVLYVMSRDQRVEYNHALYAAQLEALSRKLPLIVLFFLYPKITNRQRAHYAFMIEGLQQVEQTLQKLHIPFLVLTGNKLQLLQTAVQKYKAASVYFDFSPLRGPTGLVSQAARTLTVPCYVVDTHNIVPVWIASPKQEWSAFTFRKKVTPLLSTYLTATPPLTAHPYHLRLPQVDWKVIFTHINTPHNHVYLKSVTAGRVEALRKLNVFLQSIEKYETHRNNPTQNAQSNLNPYLHFGQISSQEIAITVQDYLTERSQHHAHIQPSADAFLEELIIRKELADNYCYYNPRYDSHEGMPEWAQKTLKKHASDPRPHLYSFEELELGETNDDVWNAAQQELLYTGKMHGYMRMYWAKKLLEWTPDARTAISCAATLNDRYSLDGYDPNGYTGILWSIGGLHDRPWPERSIYGTVRTMTQNGLRRKFPVDLYINSHLKKKV